MIASCEPGRKAWHLVNGPLRDAEPRGALWVFPARGPEARKPKQIQLEGYPEGHYFHPMGLKVYPAHSSQDDSFMYVVNHAKNGGYITTIEQFSISWSDPAIATHIRTLSSPHFVSLNALALTSPTSFYVTNDHYLVAGYYGFLDEALYMVETLLGLPLSWVSHVSIHPNEHNSSVNVEHEVVARGIAFANGISLSSSGETVAVASSSLAEVLLFNRNLSSNALSFSSRIPLPFAPDNLAFYHPDGHGDAESLIVAGHPHFPSLGSVAQSVPGAIAPSWVLSLTPRPPSDDTSTSFFSSSNTSSESRYDTEAPVSASRKAGAVESHEAKTLYQSDGRAFGTSASGLWDADGNGAGKGVLYVTGIFEEGLLMCSEA